MDNIPPDRRSENMRRIKSKNTKPERQVRSLLHKSGFRYRLHQAPICPVARILCFPNDPR